MLFRSSPLFKFALFCSVVRRAGGKAAVPAVGSRKRAFGAERSGFEEGTAASGSEEQVDGSGQQLEPAASQESRRNGQAQS